jgi:nitrate/nitrite-specific signal transduction histidine kinase
MTLRANGRAFRRLVGQELIRAMLKSLQGRLTLLFLAFVLLVVVSVGAMLWGSEAQRQDALLINLAGRQRMLAQQMARLAFEAGASEETVNAALQETAQTFDQTLRALRDGGDAPYADTVVTLRQQVSYFAAHESTHLAQIKALV